MEKRVTLWTNERTAKRTDKNKHYSRSHMMVQLHFEKTFVNENARSMHKEENSGSICKEKIVVVKRGTLNLVDLAGSEGSGEGCCLTRQQKGISINQRYVRCVCISFRGSTRSMTKVEHVPLLSSSGSDDIAERLAAVLMENKTLKVVDLSCDKISKDGAKRLADSLCHKKSHKKNLLKS